MTMFIRFCTVILLAMGVSHQSTAAGRIGSSGFYTTTADKIENNRFHTTVMPSRVTQKNEDKKLLVTATAYNSLAAQTDSTPDIAAWGDRLRPGMKAIAVSRDLLKKYGLKHKDKVKISGLDGEYQILDKMNKRWRKKIDIYMGKDRRKALKWGKKDVTIQW